MGGHQAGLFDLADRYASLSENGAPMERLSSVVDFEIFRPTLDQALGRKDRSKGGRPPMDAIMMFKVLVLQALVWAVGRTGGIPGRRPALIHAFPGLDAVGPGTGSHDGVAVSRGIGEGGSHRRVVRALRRRAERPSFLAMGGRIIDAPIIEDAQTTIDQRGAAANPRWRRPAVAAGQKRQKDTNARWTTKRGRVKAKPGPNLGGSSGNDRTMECLLIPAFGYKSHVGIDRRHGLIRRFTVTDAARHDGGQLPDLLNEDAFDSRVWVDAAYRSMAAEAAIETAGRRSMIHFRKPKGKPTPEHRRRADRARSAIRSAVEHVFADQKTNMGLFIRTIGSARATVKIGMANLAHNFRSLMTIHARSVPA